MITRKKSVNGKKRGITTTSLNSEGFLPMLEVK